MKTPRAPVARAEINKHAAEALERVSKEMREKRISRFYGVRAKERVRAAAPEGFRQAPPPPVPMPISHFLVRPRRAAAVRTNAAIDASLRGCTTINRNERSKQLK